MALKGVRAVEFSGLAPGPFCGMVLADLGAKVIRIDQPNQPSYSWLNRGKASLTVDMKKIQGVQVVRKLCKQSDVIIDPYRPGVLEKLGLGPDVLTKENPKVIYARLTGYGQYGPLSNKAGHDINFVAMSGVLSHLRTRNESKPHLPMNLLADFAGGGLMCALGIVASLFERNRSGVGKVIDASMVEGTAYLGSFINYVQNSALITDGWLDGTAHFYDVYETKDAKHIAVGAIEPKFYRAFLKGISLSESEAPHFPPSEEAKKTISRRILEKTRAEWEQVFDQLDACVTPVLSIDEAAKHPHNVIRNSFRKLPVADQISVENQAPSDSKVASNSVEKDKMSVIEDSCIFVPNSAPKMQGITGIETEEICDKGDSLSCKEILKNLNYSEEEIKQLLDDKVVSSCEQLSKL